MNTRVKNDLEAYRNRIAELENENNMLRLQIFAFVRNSAVLPIGKRLNKNEKEITDMTFAVIEKAKVMIDKESVSQAMNLATNKECRFDRID